MPVGKLFAIGLPIALGVVMIGAGAVNFVGPESVRESLRVGIIRPVFILVAALITLIRCREWGHLPGAVVLAAAAAVVAIRG